MSKKFTTGRKQSLKFPDKRTFGKTLKNSTTMDYIRAFELINSLKPCPTRIGEFLYD